MRHTILLAAGGKGSFVQGQLQWVDYMQCMGLCYMYVYTWSRYLHTDVNAWGIVQYSLV